MKSGADGTVDEILHDHPGFALQPQATSPPLSAEGRGYGYGILPREGMVPGYPERLAPCRLACRNLGAAGREVHAVPAVHPVGLGSPAAPFEKPYKERT